MADIVSPSERSRMMSGIRGKDTKPELRVRSFLHRTGLRFRLHVKTLPGRPDIVFASRKTVVFVHGCFWHQHPECRYAARPASNSDFWEEKFEANRKRDDKNVRELTDAHWVVEIVWTCQMEDRDLEELAKRIRARGTK